MKIIKRICVMLLAAAIVTGLSAPVAAEAASTPVIAKGLHFYGWSANEDTTCYLSVKKQGITKFQYRVYHNSGKLKRTATCTPDNSFSGVQIVIVEGLSRRACNTVSVRALKGGKWTKWSSKFQIVPRLNEDQVKSVADSTTGKVTLNWKTITGAQYYEVYISQKQTTGFKKVKTTARATCTLTKFKGNYFQSHKRYYYMVVAVKKVNGKIKRSNQYNTLGSQGSFILKYEFSS